MKTTSHASLASRPDNSAFLSNADLYDLSATHLKDRGTQEQEHELAEDSNAVWLVESATWFLIILTILLSFSAGYLLWAKVTSAWPFPQ